MKPYFETELGRLWHGDCLKGMENINYVDVTVTDPPYGVGKAGWDTEYVTGWERSALLKSRKGIVANTGTKNICTAITAFGDDYKDLFYGWNQNGMTRSSIGFMNVIIAVCAGKVKMGQNFCRFTIRDLTRKNHPSPKPIEYLMCLVNRFSDAGDIILDPFLGSGTTAIACERLNRRWIGIEISEEYCEIAAKRIEQEAKQLKMFK